MEKVKKIGKEYGIYIILLIVVILLKIFVVSFIVVNGTSMMNTLKNKDIMVLNKIIYQVQDIKRFDIIVIKEKDTYIIKRVIGLPGEKIEYKNNKLYVNGRYIKEDFYHKKTDDFSLEELGTTEVLENQYFVLGDNRTNSADSRMIGLIPKKDIMGKASLTIFPFNRFGIKK